MAIQQVMKNSFGDILERLGNLMDYEGDAGMQLLGSFDKVVDAWMDVVRA